jgi:glycopeptide antibiotics resistance protein
MNKPAFIGSVLVAYLVLLFKITVFKFTVYLPSGVRFVLGGYGDYGYNIVPFKTILDYASQYPWSTLVIVNLLGNVVIFMPLGFLAALLYRSISWKGILGVSAGISLLIEVLQLVLSSSTFDVDDIILNALGGLLGYALYLIVSGRRM